MPTIKKSNLHMVVLCTSDEVCDWWDKFFTDNGFNANDGQYLIRPVGTSAKELSDEIIASVNELNCVLKTTTTGPPETSTHTNTDTTTTSPSSGTTTTTSLSSGTTTTTSPGSTTTDTTRGSTTTDTTPGTTPDTTPGKNQGPVIIGSAAAGTLALLLGAVGAYRQLTGAPPELDVEEEEGGNDYGNGAQREAVVAVDEQQYA
ncbi:hypothetical protein GNI_029060 [Gregarina niphandrodes]|uniref:Uncharacterized protein n=1 Tax=Gregarina niphandrodes TaxID=110365 RepID=A0A023BB43_GRENI|nr:hypothetical protein GNI_029060 [Gregarina niphandrodes]EZG79150.1 hypothetical protein GNI_029060 [Gregarina niphandrodes]|eukprot:XP_011129121.1 hypothetical protein GNI_029060 [Gregarina niphandrodes]